MLEVGNVVKQLLNPSPVYYIENKGEDIDECV